ncbi:Intermediate transcription factor VITF-3 (2), partial [Monkeypox virus]
KELLLK